MRKCAKFLQIGLDIYGSSEQMVTPSWISKRQLHFVANDGQKCNAF